MLLDERVFVRSFGSGGGNGDRRMIMGDGFEGLSNIETVRIGKAVPMHWISLKWYIAICKPGCDELARDEFEEAGIPVFMLEGRRAQRRRGISRGPRDLVDYPVFPGYLFVGDVEGALMALQGKRHVADWKPVGGGRYEVSGQHIEDDPNSVITGFVGKDVEAKRVNGAVMQSLFVAHESAKFVARSVRDSLRSRIRIGDIVKLEGEWEAFHTGIVDKFLHGNRIEIITELFGGQVRANVALDSLEKIEA